jgi:asparagine synthase (glutamine-hydrolysing)
MCGIFGTVNYRISREEFQHQLDKIKHRGPDGYGIWENKDGYVKLGHRRLAIIDTDSRSNQPMLFGNRYAIVFNGEIYNYIEIKKELLQKGVKFVTESDTEVLFQLLLLEGPSALNKLNGMWSFVLYDEQEQRFFMSRDRLGKKPLYFIQENDQFAFASEMKSLYYFLNELEYNREMVDCSVVNFMNAEKEEQTIIKGIKKFPAGCYGYYQNGKLTTQRYYFPEQLLLQKKKHKRFEAAVEEFTSLFQSACSLRMRSDVPVGSALSGGIDSGFVVSTISKLGFSHAGYKALVSSFPGSFLDETTDAFKVANNAGVPVEAVIVNPDVDPGRILEAVYQFEDIAGTAPMPFYQLYKAFRERNVVVTLDGHGSDELFGGYSFDLYSKLADDFPHILKMRHTLNTIDKMYGFQNQITIKETIPHFKGELLKRIRRQGIMNVLTNERRYNQTLFHSTFKGMLPTLLRNYDKYSMQAGVEVRMPFLDYRIIAFAFSLPNEYKVRNGFTKAIVRKAAEPIVPASILANKVKTGWNSPLGEWFAGPWKQWLLDEVHSTAFTNCDLIDQDDILKRVDHFLTANQEQGPAQDLWLRLQPYLIEKANRKYFLNTNPLS